MGPERGRSSHIYVVACDWVTLHTADTKAEAQGREAEAQSSKAEVQSSKAEARGLTTESAEVKTIAVLIIWLLSVNGKAELGEAEKVQRKRVPISLDLDRLTLPIRLLKSGRPSVSVFRSLPPQSNN